MADISCIAFKAAKVQPIADLNWRDPDVLETLSSSKSI